jgi:hypothetical protein
MLLDAPTKEKNRNYHDLLNEGYKREVVVFLMVFNGKNK